MTGLSGAGAAGQAGTAAGLAPAATAAGGPAPDVPGAETVDRLVAGSASLLEQLGSLDPGWVARNLAISVLILVVATGLWLLARRAVRRLRHRLPDSDDGDTDSTLTSMQRLSSLALAVCTAGLLAITWGADLRGLASAEITGQVVKSLASIGLILALGVAAWRLSALLIRRAISLRLKQLSEARQAARLRTLVPVLLGLARTVIVTFTLLLVLSELGVNVGPLLAGAGIVGLAVGFGAQSLVKDFLVGVMLLLEDAASIGDIVEVGDHAGVVEHMGIRVMRLRDLEGIVHMIPYSEVSIIKNFTKDFAFALLDVGVAYGEDVDEVVATLREVAGELRKDPDYADRIREDLEVLGVDAFADSAVVIRIRLKTPPGDQWAVAREFRRRIKQRFDAEGIEIPFPHRTLYFGNPAPGDSPADAED